MDYAIHIWIIITGVLCAMSCALLGNFLLLRRMSMMGDAISHAVLPGLALAFIMTETRSSFTMFLGAALVGVLTALFTQWVHRFGKVDSGASMGVVFTTLFAIGLVLIVKAANRVDLDPGCVLYGAIEYITLDTVTIGNTDIPRATITLVIVLIVNALFVTLLFKELKISSFDPELATTVGINANVMHYLLMTMVAITTVASFEAIGSILVIAMLIVPAAAAHLWTDRLLPMIVMSLFIGAAGAALGHLAAVTVPTWFGFEDTTTSGMMALVVGLLFVAALFTAPRHGLVVKWLNQFALKLRIIREDVVGVLYRLEELAGHAQPLDRDQLRESLDAQPLALHFALRGLRRGGQVVEEKDGYSLSDRGRRIGSRLVRTHRLWESFLHEHLNLPVDHLHVPAEKLEHITDDAIAESLSRSVVGLDVDPQGKPIPPTE